MVIPLGYVFISFYWWLYFIICKSHTLLLHFHIDGHVGCFLLWLLQIKFGMDIYFRWISLWCKRRMWWFGGGLIAQSCPALATPWTISSLGSSVHGILQARMLEWVALSFSRGSSQPRDQTWVSYISCVGGGFFTDWAIRIHSEEWLDPMTDVCLIFKETSNLFSKWCVCVCMCVFCSVCHC